MQARRDIVLLHENSSGQDFILADLHGNSVLLDLAFATLQPTDRLFLLGDLTDRGHDSQGVMRKLLDYIAKHPNQVYVVVGNHETSCLDALAALAELTEDLRKLPSTTALADWKNRLQACEPATQAAYDIQFHLDNGGEWLIDLYHQELVNNALDTPGSLINRIRAFLESIPYIIHVDGKRPFICAHADLHLTDADILTRDKLTKAEINYLTNARLVRTEADRNNPGFEPIIDPHPRNATSTIVYVGHFIIVYGETPAIRSMTNSVNLDSAAFKTYAALLVNHTAARCDILATKQFAKQFSSTAIMLRQLCEAVQTHLTNERLRYDNLNNELIYQNDHVDSSKRERNLSVLQNNSLMKRSKSQEPPGASSWNLTIV